MTAALTYGLLQLRWALAGPPWPPRTGDDLAILSHGGVVVLCGAAALIAAVLRWRRVHGRALTLLLAFGAVISLLLAAASVDLLLDVAHLVLPASGALFHWGAFFSRLGGLGVGIALGVTVLTAHRRRRRACLSCGRRPNRQAPPATPQRWVIAAAYTVVLACVIRVAAQLSADRARGESMFIGAGADPAAVVFGVTALLAGTLLPLALVHSWGRFWPSWTGPLAQRRVPRWLLLGPGGFIAAGMTLYFTISMIHLISDPSVTEAADYSLTFWITVSAYFSWGLGLCIVVASYWLLTRPACARCGRGHVTGTDVISSTGVTDTAHPPRTS